MPLYDEVDEYTPIQEGVDFSDNLAGKVEEIEPVKKNPSYPTLGSLVNNDEFKKLPSVRQAYALGQYRNRMLKYLSDNGKIESKEQFEGIVKNVGEAINKYMPSGNDIDSILSSSMDRREVISELAGLGATARVAGRASYIKNQFNLMAQADTHTNYSGEEFKSPSISSLEDYVKKFDSTFQELESLRSDMEASLDDDKDIEGRDQILGQGLSLSTIGNVGSRMAIDIPMVMGAGMATGGSGALGYFSLVGAARSDRELRRSKPEMSTTERGARAGITGLASGSLEAIGFGYLTNGTRALKLTKVMQNVVPASMRKVLGASMAEASTEFAQTYIEHFGHNVEALDDFITIMQDPKVAEEAMSSALVGGILGAGIRGGIEVSTPAIDKIIQTDVYKNARKKLHEKVSKLDLSKRMVEPISDLSESIIKTSKLINEESKNLEELEIQRDAGQIVGEAIAEDATKRDLVTPEEGGPGIEIDGRFEKQDILTASEAREQGESSITQDSDIEAKDFIPTNEGTNIGEIIRQSVKDNGGIDITQSKSFKDSLQDADGNPVFSPKFKASKDNGLSLDRHIEILAEQGIVPRDVNPDVVIDALNGKSKDFADQRNSQPSLEDLEMMAQDTPNAEFESEVEEALFFRDPDARETIRQSKEQAESVTAAKKVPKEAMPVPFNINNDPKLRADTTRKIRSIAKLIENDLGIPVRRGKFRQKALGIFKTNSKVVRTKMANDLQVMAHEVGHALSDRFGLATDTDSSFDGEIIPLGEKTSGPNYTLEQKREEGRAEFFREFLVNPNDAKKIAPKFHKALTEAISQDSKTEAGVQRLSEAYADITNQSARERVMSTIETPEEVKEAKGKDSIKDKLLADEIRFLDKNAALRVLRNEVYGKKDISILDDPHRMMQLSAGASDVANRFIESGIHDSNDNKLSKGLLEIIDGMSNQELREFDGYLKALRAQDLHEDGKTVGLDPEVAKRSISEWEKLNPEFKDKQKQIKEFTDALMNYAVREGVTTQEEANKMLKKNPHYIPFARIFDRNDSKSTGTVDSPFKFLKGDSSSTLSGLAALEANVLTTVRAAANMKVYKALNKMTEIPGAGKFMEKVDGYGRDEPIISFVNNGKRTFLRVKDELIYDTLTYSPSSAAFGTGMIASMLTGSATKAAKFVNLTAIVTPAFVGKNAVRDTFAAGIQSKNNFIPIVDSIRGMMEVISNSKSTQQFLRQGGGQATFTRQVADMTGTPKITQSQAMKVLKSLNPISMLSSLSEKVELAPRVIEFKKTYDNAIKSGKTVEEALAEGAYNGRDLTIDFNVGGTWTKKANTLTPFLNANIQGKRKLLRTLATKKGLAYSTFMVMGLEGLLYAMNMGNEDYEEQPEHVKDNYWLFPGAKSITGEPFMKIPKPQGYSWFSNRMRNALDSMTGKEKDAVKQFGSRMFRDFNDEWQSMIPAIAKPILEISTNHSFFRNNNIINTYIKDLPLKEQYNAYTSEVAKNVGPAIGISPIYFDHLVYGYFTNWGKATTSSIDSTFLKRIEQVPTPDKDFGKSTMAELTGLKSFFASNPDYGAASIQQIFEMNTELSGMKRLIKSRGEDERQELIAENPELWKSRYKIEGAYSQIKSIGKKVKYIYDHPTMSPTEKKMLLRKNFDKMLELSRKALGKK